MDKTREADLDSLKKVFNDYSKPRSVRENAYRSYQNILRQAEDKELSEMRLRLVRGIRAGDTEFTEKMSERIQDYSWRKGYMSQR